jgi:hypothetical protein
LVINLNAEYWLSSFSDEGSHFCKKLPIAKKKKIPSLGVPQHLICLDSSFTEIHMTDKESLEDAFALFQTDIKTINYVALGLQCTHSQRTRPRRDVSEKQRGSCGVGIPWESGAQ